VRNPATINRFRPVTTTAFLAVSFSQTFIFLAVQRFEYSDLR
jgi:hypothetical protein